MTLTPDPDEFFVLIWREENSKRLRTYVDSQGLPIATPLVGIYPQTGQVIRTQIDLAFWLASPVTGETVALSEELARSELGWLPARSSSTGLPGGISSSSEEPSSS